MNFEAEDGSEVIIHGERVVEFRADQPNQIWIHESIVRCKDCEYAKPFKNEEYPLRCCYDFPMVEQPFPVGDYHFCNHGKRKSI